MISEQDMIEVLKGVSDKFGGFMDQWRAGLVMAFRCSVSGLFYPEDYIKGWGTRYGIGLGPHVCSESLQSDYTTPPAEISNLTRAISQIMHPLGSSRAQMDHVMISPLELKKGSPVIALDDPYYETRGPILRAKQLINPRGRIKILSAKFENQ
jgi:hypothetical protein